MEKWFRIEKRFFNTWFPNNLDGWVVTIAMTFSVSTTFFFAYLRTTSINQALTFSFPFISLILSIAILTASYFGERPIWGKEHKNELNYNSDSPFSYLFLSFIFVPIAFIYLTISFVSSVIFFTVVLLLFLSFLNLEKSTKL